MIRYVDLGERDGDRHMGVIQTHLQHDNIHIQHHMSDLQHDITHLQHALFDHIYTYIVFDGHIYWFIMLDHIYSYI